MTWSEQDADMKTPVARYVPIQIGITTPELTEIAEPDIDGRIVTLGQHLLEDGSKLILPDSIKVSDQNLSADESSSGEAGR